MVLSALPQTFHPKPSWLGLDLTSPNKHVHHCLVSELACTGQLLLHLRRKQLLIDRRQHSGSHCRWRELYHLPSVTFCSVFPFLGPVLTTFSVTWNTGSGSGSGFRHSCFDSETETASWTSDRLRREGCSWSRPSMTVYKEFVLWVLKQSYMSYGFHSKYSTFIFKFYSILFKNIQNIIFLVAFAL